MTPTEIMDTLRALAEIGYVIRLEWSDPGMNERGEELWRCIVARGSYGVSTDLGEVVATVTGDDLGAALADLTRKLDTIVDEMDA